jgi:methionyl-tRNA formyltransferase
LVAIDTVVVVGPLALEVSVVKIVMMGSPDFAVPSLEALVEARHDIPLVVTQPDRRAGRGRKLVETAVKRAARELGLPWLDYGKGDRKRVTETVLAIAPDVVVVAAFGHILREPVLSSPRFGCLNVHASLLPRWRGVSPVQYAVLHGDAWTGVTIMQMDAGVDTGPVLTQRSVGIAPDETAGELIDRLAGLGADLLIHTLRDLEAGQIEPRAQTDEGAVYAPKLTRSLSPVRWDRDVVTVHNQIRALQPYPGATSFMREQLLKITEACPYGLLTSGESPGCIVEVTPDGLCVACGSGVLLITRIQAPGRNPLPVPEFLRGFAVQKGQTFHS